MERKIIKVGSQEYWSEVVHTEKANVTVYHPILTDEERAKRKAALIRALENFGMIPD